MSKPSRTDKLDMTDGTPPLTHKPHRHHRLPPGMKLKGSKIGALYSSPLGIWLAIFFTVPVCIIFLYSFMAKGLRGGVEWRLSLEAFAALANPVFARVALNTLGIAALSTTLTILLALPCAYYMARMPKQAWLLLLVIIPFWVNFLIRVYAWIALLGREGMLNDLLLNLGFIKEPIQFLFNTPTVVLVHVYSYLPYAILPLYSSIGKLDFTLLEAARDLGATHMQSLRKVLLPNIRTGIFTAVIFSFIPTFGSYAIPDLVGGPDSYMLGNIVANEILKTRNWPLASSISVLITVLTSLALLIWFLPNQPSRARTARNSSGEAG